MLKAVPTVLVFFSVLVPISAQSLSITGRVTRPVDAVFYVDSQVAEEGSYRLERSAALPAISWTPVTETNAFPGRITLKNITRGPIGFYRVARLTYPPAITFQPQGSTNFMPVEVKLTAGVTGSWPLRTRWYKDGRALDGAISTNLTFTGRPDLSGAFSLVVTNRWGAVTSAPVNIKILSTVAASISGKTVKFTVTSAEGEYIGTGNYSTTFDSFGFFTTTGSSIFLNDTGNWQYGVVNDNTARIALPGSVAKPNGLVTLAFETLTTGQYSVTAPGKTGFEVGTFEFLN